MQKGDACCMHRARQDDVASTEMPSCKPFGELRVLQKKKKKKAKPGDDWHPVGSII